MGGGTRFGRGVAVSLAVLLSIASVLSWVGRLHPVAEMFANGRYQMLIIGLGVMALAALVRLWKIAGLVLVLVVTHVFSVLPYFTGTPDPVDQAATATVLQYNIYFANDDYAAIAGVINQSGADVVTLQELTIAQWAALSPLLDAYPYQMAVPVSDEIGQLGGGMALVSRTPMEPVVVTSPANEPARPILASRTTVAGHDVTVIGLHPHASRFSGEKVRLREQQLAAVIDVAAAAPGPVVVMTDMNITPTSPAYDDFLTTVGWRDPHRLAGWNASWPSGVGGLGFPIDHIFVSDEIRLHSYETGDGAGSDHRTLTATISIG